MRVNDYLQVTSDYTDVPMVADAISGKEGLSRLYAFRVSIRLPAGTPPPFSQLIGSQMSVTISLPSQPKRIVSGIVTTLVATGGDNAYDTYLVTLRPKLWQTSRNRNCRIFQQQSVQTILVELFKSYNVKFSFSDGATYPTHNYCVQYKESDFDFASRLMEEEGMYYYFTFSDSGETMVISDTSITNPAAQLGDVSGDPIVRYLANDTMVDKGPTISTWNRSQRLQTSKVTLRDHHFQQAGKTLESTASAPTDVTMGAVTHKLSASASAEQYDGLDGFAHRFDDIGQNGGAAAGSPTTSLTGESQRMAKVRVGQATSRAVGAQGASNCPALVPGYYLTLQGNSNADGQYLVVSVEHRLTVTVQNGTAQFATYSNRLRAIPYSVNYRPKRKTPRPNMKGLHPATVVGTDGTDVSADSYGRVKVSFHWDRKEPDQLNTSCWLRVATIWAGKGYGATFVPRIGMEVLVSFVDGDADQPVIVGCVPNSINTPHHGLPGNQLLSGWRTQTANGLTSQYNELTFNDTPSSEYVNLHAERNLYTQAEQSQVVSVGSTYSMLVGSTQTKNGGPSENSNAYVPTGDLARYEQAVNGYSATFVGYEQPQSLPLDISPLSATDVSSKNWPNNGVSVGDSMSTREDGTATKTGDLNLSVAGNHYERVGGNSYEYVVGQSQFQTGGTYLEKNLNGYDRTANAQNVVTVNGDDYLTVGFLDDNAGTMTGGNQFVDIANDQNITIGGEQNVTIKGKQNITAKSAFWKTNESNARTRNMGVYTENVNFGNYNTQTLGLTTFLTLGGTVALVVGFQGAFNFIIGRTNVDLYGYSRGWSNGEKSLVKLGKKIKLEAEAKSEANAGTEVAAKANVINSRANEFQASLLSREQNVIKRRYSAGDVTTTMAVYN